MDPRPPVPFTFMFVAAFLVLVGVGVVTKGRVVQQQWANLTSP